MLTTIANMKNTECPRGRAVRWVAPKSVSDRLSRKWSMSMALADAIASAVSSSGTGTLRPESWAILSRVQCSTGSLIASRLAAHCRLHAIHSVTDISAWPRLSHTARNSGRLKKVTGMSQNSSRSSSTAWCRHTCRHGGIEWAAPGVSLAGMGKERTGVLG
jgi:hypothetical protein